MVREDDVNKGSEVMVLRGSEMVVLIGRVFDCM